MKKKVSMTTIVIMFIDQGGFCGTKKVVVPQEVYVNGGAKGYIVDHHMKGGMNGGEDWLLLSKWDALALTKAFKAAKMIGGKQ